MEKRSKKEKKKKEKIMSSKKQNFEFMKEMHICSLSIPRYKKYRW